MFTGLIEAVGEVTGREERPAGVRLAVRTSLARELSQGDSIAVNGVCLTAVALDHAGFACDVGPETMRVTTTGGLSHGMLVNLERPLREDGRVGGHFVLGHVDAVGRITRVVDAADFQWLTVAFPPELAPYIVHKGSIAVDGISLTVARLDTGSFDVQIVPYTIEHTNLKAARAGDMVNLETDVLGKYVVRAMELGTASAAGQR